MTFLDLQRKIKSNLFTILDVQKIFPLEIEETIRIQLSRFAKRGLLAKLKKGLYVFDLSKVDEFIVANQLYYPSYISMETALNYYGIIPDVPQTITSVTSITTKKFISSL